MKIILEALLPFNTGKAFTVLKGQRIRIIGQSTADFVCFAARTTMPRFGCWVSHC